MKDTTFLPVGPIYYSHTSSGNHLGSDRHAQANIYIFTRSYRNQLGPSSSHSVCATRNTPAIQSSWRLLHSSLVALLYSTGTYCTYLYARVLQSTLCSTSFTRINFALTHPHIRNEIQSNYCKYYFISKYFSSNRSISECLEPCNQQGSQLWLCFLEGAYIGTQTSQGQFETRLGGCRASLSVLTCPGRM